MMTIILLENQIVYKTYEMDLKSAIDILSIHNDWRRDNTGDMPHVQPKILGEAIDLVVREFKNSNFQRISTWEFSYDEDFSDIEITLKIPNGKDPYDVLLEHVPEDVASTLWDRSI